MKLSDLPPGPMRDAADLVENRRVTHRRIFDAAGRVWWRVDGSVHGRSETWIGADAEPVSKIYGMSRRILESDEDEKCTTVHLSTDEMIVLVARGMTGYLYACGWCSHTSASDWRFCPNCGSRAGVGDSLPKGAGL